MVFESEKIKQSIEISRENDFTEANKENDFSNKHDQLCKQEENDDTFYEETSHEAGTDNKNNVVTIKEKEIINYEDCDVVTSDNQQGADSLSNNCIADENMTNEVTSIEETTLTNRKSNSDLEEISETLLPRSIQSNYSREAGAIQDRSTKFRQIVSRNSPVPNSSKFIKRRCLGGASPSAGRIKRLMHGLQTKPIVEKIEEVGEDDILTFTREIPSPLAVPRNSILKRKLSDTDDLDAISPVTKVSAKHI